MVDPAQMLQGRTRETKIRRDNEGRWFNGEEAITHPLLRQAFDAWLIPAPDGSGRWALSNSINWAFVAIEGPPRFVRSAVVSDDHVALSVSDGQTVRLAIESMREGPEGALYCDVPGPDGRLAARFDRSAMMQLASVIDEDEDGVFLRLGKERVRPPRVADPLSVAAAEDSE
ncbi:MAG: hypothetical protein AB8I08_08940 [Sandaracinaceae bacterium]